MSSPLKNHAFISLPAIAFIAASVYVASNIFANILSVKMILLPFPFPFNEVDAGTLIFPLSFIVRDMLHKNAGKLMASTVVLSVVGINITMVGLFYLVAILPPAPSWAESGRQEAFVLTILPASRIALGSIIAQLISGLFNTYLFSKIIRQDPNKKDIIASVISNFLSIILDTVVFAFVAFAWSLPWSAVTSIIMVNIVLKSIIILIGSPLVRFIKVQVDPKLL